ncbi:MAG: thioesterase II family protein [Dermatophilaceae bacterium]
MVTPRWFLSRPASTDAAHRLFCLPYAGGSAAAYRDWHERLHPDVQVYAVELPGRGMRFTEAPFVTATGLVRHLADLVQPVLGQAHSFFGHSMGGLLAYELVRELQRRGCPPPRHLFVSGAATPGTRPNRMPLQDATDEQVVEELRDLGGTPPEVLESEELVQIVARALRADYSVLGTYSHDPGGPLDVPITVLGGQADPLVPPPHLGGWRRLTTDAFRIHLLPGDHFFVHSSVEDLVRIVRSALVPDARQAPLAANA